MKPNEIEMAEEIIREGLAMIDNDLARAEGIDEGNGGPSYKELQQLRAKTRHFHAVAKLMRAKIGAKGELPPGDYTLTVKSATMIVGHTGTVRLKIETEGQR